MNNLNHTTYGTHTMQNWQVVKTITGIFSLQEQMTARGAQQRSETGSIQGEEISREERE